MMKRCFLIAIVLFSVFASCTLSPDYGIMTGSTSLEDAEGWVINNIEYTLDRNSNGRLVNHTSTPLETFETRKGECKDMAVLFMYIAHHELGYAKESIVINAAYDSDFDVGHAYVTVNDVAFLEMVTHSGEKYDTSTYDNIRTYSYERTMWWVENMSDIPWVF